MLKNDASLTFSEITFRICGPLNVIVSVPNLAVFLLSEYRGLKNSEIVCSFFKQQKNRPLLEEIANEQIYIFLWRDVQYFIGV